MPRNPFGGIVTAIVWSAHLLVLLVIMLASAFVTKTILTVFDDLMNLL